MVLTRNGLTKPTNTSYPMLFGVQKFWKDAADLEGAYAAGWDNDYLYISVKVTDDIYVQNTSGAMIYEGDSMSPDRHQFAG